MSHDSSHGTLDHATTQAGVEALAQQGRFDHADEGNTYDEGEMAAILGRHYPESGTQIVRRNGTVEDV